MACQRAPSGDGLAAPVRLHQRQGRCDNGNAIGMTCTASAQALAHRPCRSHASMPWRSLWRSRWRSCRRSLWCSEAPDGCISSCRAATEVLQVHPRTLSQARSSSAAAASAGVASTAVPAAEELSGAATLPVPVSGTVSIALSSAAAASSASAVVAAAVGVSASAAAAGPEGG